MNQSRGCAAILLLLLATAPPSAAAGPIEVRAEWPRGPFYVGQAIELTITAIATERPRVEPPRVAGADVTPVGSDVRALSTSGIGNVVTETSRYRFRFRLVPRRPGVLRVPPVSARAGARSATATPRPLTVRDLPPGAPDAFLGGVGPLQLAAEARPPAVRVGRDLEYRLRLSGPAALGSRRRPALRGLDRAGLALDAQPLPDEETALPPSRVFRWRLRPARAGEARLPPVRVAHFDPGSGTYLTQVAPGVPIRVADVPRWDPSSWSYGASPSLAAWSGAVAPTLGGGLALAIAWAALAWARRRRRRVPRDPRRVAADLATAVAVLLPAAAIARRIAEGLADYLHLAAGRPPGALTPDEARRWVADLADPDLGDRARRLVAECDRVLYDELESRPQGDSEPTLGERGGRFFEELSRVEPGQGDAGEGGNRERHS
jgi:hypothetical protein